LIPFSSTLPLRVSFFLFSTSLYRTPHYPSEDSKLRAQSITRRRGGNCPNSAEVLSQIATPNLGRNLPYRRPLLIATVPDVSSLDYKFIRKSFLDVNLEHCIVRRGKDEAPKSFIIRSKSTDSRTIVNYNELDEMTVEEFTEIFERICKNVSWWHFEVGVYPGAAEYAKF
jgi:ketohexokinase